MAKGKLPKKLSELIRLALTDLRKVERNKNYKVDMNTWHTPNGVCRVCLAGAVMAGTLGADPTTVAAPSYYGRDSGKLAALDEVRCGYLEDAIRAFTGKPAAQNVPFHKPMPEYTPRTKTKFHAAMRKVATQLAKLGY
jgi:hypothetical protein